MDYDYQYGVNPSTIELDEVEEVRVTCIDRARIALEQTGQIHCSQIMGRLQIQFDEMAEFMRADPNKPCEILDMIMREWGR